MRIIGSIIAFVIGVSDIAAALPAAAEDLGSIMCLGDSITYGYGNSTTVGGYRDPLYTLLTNAGYRFDFVGSSTANSTSKLTAAGQSHHEGHCGYLINGVGASSIWSYGGLDENLSTWLGSSGSHPGTILLMIGTNDLSANYDLTNAPSRLTQLLADIYSYLPNATIYLASLTPRTSLNARVLAYNAALPSIVTSYQSTGKSIHFVDMYDALTTSDLCDGLHPDADGYAKMADVWYTALTATPEPSSMVLFCTAAAGLLGYCRRRARNCNHVAC